MASKIIAIHGVGDATPGTVIDELSHILYSDAEISWRYSDVVLAGEPFPSLFSEDPSPDFIEINWSDIQRPFSTPAGLLQHFLWLLFGLLHLGERSPSANRAVRPFVTIYRYYFELVLFWSIALLVHSLLLVGLKGSGRIAAVIVFTLAIIAITVSSKKATSQLCIGYFWAGIFSAVSVYCIVTNSLSLQYVAAAATVYALTQFIAIALLVFAAIEVLCLHRSAMYRWHTRLAHLAFLYLPTLFVSCAGPVALAFCASILPDSQQLIEWEHTFKQHMLYDFVTAEILMTISVAALPLLALLGAIGYFVVRENRRGIFAQQWLFFLLVAAPLILAANLLLLMIQNSPTPIFQTAEFTFLETYKYSALRVLPFLPFLVGPLTVVLDILSDIVFYALPPQHPLSTRNLTQSRFVHALNFAVSNDSDCTVFAHSQGSVIAVDALAHCSIPAVTLVTLGSPIDSLYLRYLNYVSGSEKPLGCVSRWFNCYRSGDYVGGSIERADINKNIGPGEHVGYWNDSEFAEHMVQMGIVPNPNYYL